MNDDKTTVTKEPAPEVKTGTPPKTVTSSRDIDFPSLGWGISAGETRELPADPDAQAAILSNTYITLTK